MIKLEYYAHYDKNKNTKQLLKEHLKSVAELSKYQIPPTVNFDAVSNGKMKDLCYWIGYLHDMGKYTKYFQDYLIKGEDSRFRSHAPISACIVYLFLKDEALDTNNNSIEEEILKFLCYVVVRLHHEALRVNSSLFSISRENSVWNNLLTERDNLFENKAQILKDSNLKSEIKDKYFEIEKLKKDRLFTRIPTFINQGRFKKDYLFFFIIYIFSVLIDNDKINSSQIDINKVKRVSPDKVEKYINSKPANRGKIDLNDKRNKSRKTMINVITSLSDAQIVNTGFFFITAPTGIGKTLSSLECALILQKRMNKIMNYNPRIISAIPFINIIEQNKIEYENVFDNELKLIIHHRLSDFSNIKSGNNKNMSLDKALLDVEAWDGDVILTTFVQFFQSIFTGKNRPLKKLNKMSGSIIILDEIQAVPEKYMPLIGAVLKKVNQYYGTKFILMTATQPKILEFSKLILKDESEIDNSIQLLPDYKDYFQSLHRTKLIPLLNKKLTNGEFVSLMFEKWDNKKSVLIVVNTIKRSIEVYNKLKGKIKDTGINTEVYYLSTNIIPQQRKKVIGLLKKKLKSKVPLILVSTQTIEAGVNLDFDMGFRDFAPICSLIQTAGRINREGERKEYCPLYIVRLEDDNSYVYQLMNLKLTKGILKKYPEIDEDKYGELTEEYYDMELNESGFYKESKTIWNEGILKLNFGVIEEFKLIDKLEDVVDVFVEKDTKASKIADAYEAVLKSGDKIDYDLKNIGIDKNLADKYRKKISFYEKKALLKLINGKLSDYIIQVRLTRIKDNRPIEFKARGGAESNLFWIPKDQIDQYYDENTGYKREKGEDFFVM
ncbi:MULTISPECIES: CRISPR-associated helicase Cas3' [Clostridium]|uniref:CRISPR-associated helicase Cas3 n=1 Tax=Clostridium lapidicellarium TaxID=3240931 RepID=A0ABV4E1E3_9CLOT